MLLKVEKLTKYYNIKKIFGNISFHINQGDKIGIIGINGKLANQQISQEEKVELELQYFDICKKLQNLVKCK